MAIKVKLKMVLTKKQKEMMIARHKEFMEKEKKKNRMSSNKTERQEFYQTLKSKHPDIASAIQEDYKFRKKLPKWSGLKSW